MPDAGEDARGWYLGRGVEGGQVAGEPPGGGQPVRPLDRCAPRLSGPGDDQVRGERGRAGGFAEADQLSQLLALAGELEPQRPAQPQIVVGVTSKAAHQALPVGQGCATVRSKSRSTRA